MNNISSVVFAFSSLALRRVVNDTRVGPMTWLGALNSMIMQQ